MKWACALTNSVAAVVAGRRRRRRDPAAALRWELRGEDGGGAWLVARVAVTIGGVSTWPPVSDATSEALDALTPPPDWRALADAEDAVTREAFGAAGHDGEEWTEARE